MKPAITREELIAECKLVDSHKKIHIRTFNAINFSTNRIKECFESSTLRSSPVLRWIGFCERGALAAAAQARSHICPKGGL